MNWVEIDKENLPKGEVLACCISDNGELAACVGILFVNKKEEARIDCEGVDSYWYYLENCTHYLDFHSVKPKINQ